MPPPPRSGQSRRSSADGWAHGRAAWGPGPALAHCSNSNHLPLPRRCWLAVPSHRLCPLPAVLPDPILHPTSIAISSARPMLTAGGASLSAARSASKKEARSLSLGAAGAQHSSGRRAAKPGQLRLSTHRSSPAMVASAGCVCTQAGGQAGNAGSGAGGTCRRHCQRHPLADAQARCRGCRGVPHTILCSCASFLPRHSCPTRLQPF